MNGPRFLPYAVLAAALLVAACARAPDIPLEEQLAWHEATTQEQVPEYRDPTPHIEDDNGFWEHFFRVHGPGPVYFDLDSAALRPDALETIKQFVRWVDDYLLDSAFMVEGHTDPRGPADHNLDLGCRRARAVRDALIERGFAAERLGIVSYGEARPAVLGDNEAAWAQNRRAVYQMVDTITSSNCTAKGQAR